MGRYRYLLKNIGLLTLSSFATKLLSFFLVPLYTNILTTTEYGIYDFFNTTVGILVPVLTLNIQESVMRFSMESKYSRKAIATLGTRYFLISNLLVAMGLVVNCIFGFNAIAKQYPIYFFLIYITHSLSGIILAYIRGIGRIAELAVSSVAASTATIGCNVLFLVVLKWGLEGYFLANIIGPFVQCIYLVIRAHTLKDIHLLERYPEQSREMTAYSKPLIVNSIAWWVNNASDKYVVIFFCGLGENGVYSVASKIPSILNICQSIFAQAWTLSAVKDYDPEDKNGFFANTYAAYNCLMTVLCSAIIVTDKALAGFLYAKDFYPAWRYVPWMTIAIVFGALTGYIGGFFSAVKNSKISARSTLVGAVTNIAMNIMLIPFIGPLGAAIATAVSYCIVWAVRYIHAKRFIRLRVKLGRDIASYVLLAVQAMVLLMIDSAVMLYGIEGILFIVVVMLYFGDISSMLRKLLHTANDR